VGVRHAKSSTAKTDSMNNGSETGHFQSVNIAVTSSSGENEAAEHHVDIALKLVPLKPLVRELVYITQRSDN
jgi:hypothetical protein